MSRMFVAKVADGLYTITEIDSDVLTEIIHELGNICGVPTCWALVGGVLWLWPKPIAQCKVYELQEVTSYE